MGLREEFPRQGVGVLGSVNVIVSVFEGRFNLFQGVGDFLGGRQRRLFVRDDGGGRLDDVAAGQAEVLEAGFERRPSRS